MVFIQTYLFIQKTKILNMKSKTAFSITATVDGESWERKSTTLTANSEGEAIEKAKTLLKLKERHKVEIEPITVFASTEKLETNDYPYGRLRATAFFSVEHNGRKGMRTVFQTINPKNGQLNKPKHSTYSTVILPMQKLNGHFEYCGYIDFNGTDEINKGLQFMADFHELFTPEQIKDIALTALAMSKVNVKAMCIYAGSTWEDLKPLVTNSVETLVKIANTGENLWASAMLDEEAIEATKKPNYNPFKQTLQTA